MHCNKIVLHLHHRNNYMKTITLSVEQAKSLYNTNKELRSTILHDFTDSELGIEIELREWEDLKFFNSLYPIHNGNIYKQINLAYAPFLNVPTEKHAKALIAFAKLSMLMDDLGDECNVNWSERSEIKYTIERYKNELISEYYDFTSSHTYQFLAFKTKSIRNRFLDKHKQLIKDYFMID